MDTKTKWIKTGKVHDFVFLAKEVIATASGYHVIFYNLVTNEERIEYFNDSSRGEGACCLAAHPVIPVFSTAERCYNPKILIHTYPDIKKVAVCKLNKNSNVYLSCCFTGTEFILSLTTFPEFQLIVWRWRTGERMSNINTMATDEHQILKSPNTLQNLAFHYSITPGKLSIYEINSYSKGVFITKNDNVYIASSDGKKIQVILNGDSEVPTDRQLSILPLQNGFLMVDKSSRLSYFNKTVRETQECERWDTIWSIDFLSHPVKLALAQHEEAILVQDESGRIFKCPLSQNKQPKSEEVMVDHRDVTTICALEPLETHIILLNRTNELMIFDILEEQTSTSLSISHDDPVTCMTTHPQLPVIALCTSTGKCILLTGTESKIEIVKILFVQNQPLEIVKFSDTGQVLGMISKSPSQLFLVKTILNEEINIILHKELEELIADILIFDKVDYLQIYLLITSSSLSVGNRIEIYFIESGQNSPNMCHRVFLNSYYGSLCYGTGGNYDFSSSPYLSKQIHFFRIEKDRELIVMTEAVQSHHELRKCQITSSRDFIVTSSPDGRIVIRNNSNVTTVVDTFAVHHYQEGGTALSLFLARSGMIVSLGKNGSLVGIQYSTGNDQDQTELQKKLKEFHRSKWRPPKEQNLDSSQVPTWMELKKMKLVEQEMMESLECKEYILQGLNGLRKEIGDLIDVNAAKRVECQVPLLEFELDRVTRATKIQSGINVRVQTEMAQQQTIDKVEEVISYLIDKHWNKIEVHDSRLWSFDCTIGVDNFALKKLSSPHDMHDFYIEFFDTPLQLPKTNQSYRQINESVIEEPSLPLNLEKSAKDMIENTYSEQGADLFSLSSTSARWIGKAGDGNHQAKEPSNDVHHEIGSSKEYQLKKCFNREFDAMHIFKCRILQTCIERLQRIKKFKNELSSFFKIETKTSEMVEILWHSEKIPKGMIKMTEDDIFSTTESDPRQEFRDETLCRIDTGNFIITEEISRFRRIKLEEMMDGLLEVRWEDEVKRSIPKPECLVSKKSWDYDEKDIKALKLYNDKVRRLEKEREKYKNYLESEINSLESIIKGDLEDFQLKMEELALGKMNIKSAILQEFFLFLVKRRENFLQSRGKETISRIMSVDLVSMELKNEETMNKITALESIVIDLRSKFENLAKRDKTYEAKFRNEFADLKQPMVEHLLRQYKRRPRIGQIVCTSLTCLVETMKCLTSGKKSAILPREYLDFLRGMDALDVMPNNLPPQIETNHWSSLCKLRRNRVEIEIKMRVAAIELTETEQTLVHLHKLSSSTQSQIFSMRNHSEEEIIKLNTISENPDVQLVLKTAQVEISIAGNVDDYENVVVVPCRQLLDLNHKILKEGERKVRMMRSFMNLKNIILARSWKNRCISKSLENSLEHLSALRNLRVKKEMRNYLLERLERCIRYKDANSCDRMLKSVRKKFQRMLRIERVNLQRIIREIKYWANKNVELLTCIQEFSLKKQLDCSVLEEDPLYRKNRIFHAQCLDSIMERNVLVEDVKRNRDELLGLKAELELLKLKTFPTLRFKDRSYQDYSISLQKEKRKT